MNTAFSSRLKIPASFVGNGLISTPALTALRKLAESIEAKNIVEVGSWHGLGSTLELAKAVGDYGMLVCVDSWMIPTTFNMFMGNIAKAGVSGRIVPLRTWSVSAAALFQPESFDMVFIDGGHSYECVMSDIRVWLPLVRKGGILCGDDYNFTGDGVKRAVTDSLGTAEVFEGRIWSHNKP
jgi:predicted O-methyltransferase YrrM